MVVFHRRWSAALIGIQFVRLMLCGCHLINQANATVAGYGYRAPHITSTALAHRPVTAGGSTIVVTATGLPPELWPVLVTVAGIATNTDICSSIVRNATSITCAMPPGAGDVVLAISAACEGTQSSDNTVTVKYAPPRVSAVTTPAGQPIDGGFLVHVHGQVCRWHVV